MISDQIRMESFVPIQKEVSEIVQNPAVLSRVPEIIERVSQVAGRIVIIGAHQDTHGKLCFHGIPGSVPDFSAHQLKIFPFFAEDRFIHPELDNFLTAIKWACYHQGTHSIFLNMEVEETVPFMAFYFIHELGHALRSCKDGRALTVTLDSIERRTLEEMEMRVFDYNLALALGGAGYQSEADRMAYQIMKYRSRKNKPPPSFLGKGNVFDPYFGPAPSEEARKIREILFGFFCEMMAADRYQDANSATKIKYALAETQCKHMTAT